MLLVFNLGGMEVVAANMRQRRPNLARARQRSSNPHIFSIHSRILMLTFLY